MQKRKSRRLLEKDNKYLLNDNLRLRSELGRLKEGNKGISIVVDGILGSLAEEFGEKLDDNKFELIIRKPTTYRYEVKAERLEGEEKKYRIVAEIISE